MLLDNIINHVSFKNKVVGSIKELEDEIIHFKHIKVVRGSQETNLTDEEISLLENKVNKVKSYVSIDKKKLALNFAESKIDESKYMELIHQSRRNRLKT